MVDSSITDANRRVAGRWLKVGFVLLVGVSAGTVALQVGATGIEIAAAVAAGLLVGASLLWFTIRTLRELRPRKLHGRGGD